MAEKKLKVKNIEELEGMQVGLLFPNKQVSVVDLTAKQAAIIVNVLGFAVDEAGDIICFDDEQLDDIYGAKRNAE